MFERVWGIFNQSFDYHAILEEPVKDCGKSFLLANLVGIGEKTNLLLDKKFI
ncbi:hypothetical protein [Neobacillus niacini]|uniref:hypothetical protein n=1 Tax=Neobacillus niacini TaxID=86668 RepID=UPI0020419EEA|nr:hypothetical protein [Neobacillus niacini]MCM3694283.1 hypothetical protein [Neobacillus niacini]